MTTISLCGDDWQIGAATTPTSDPMDLSQVADWIPARVPGEVHLALQAAGRLPDPYFGKNNEKSAWVDDFDWWFRKDFALAPLAGKRAHLIFEGIDYLTDVYLNGHKLGHHEGMFGRQVYEVTSLVGENREGSSTNILAVRLTAAKDLPKLKLSWRDKVVKWLAKRLIWADLFPDRLATLKCQMGYGWDFAPRLLTAGPWDEVYLHLSDTVFVEDLFVQGEPEGETATVRVRAELNSCTAVEGELVVTVEGVSFDSPPFLLRQHCSLPAGQTQREISFRLDSPRLWQPWDRGEPNLYRLRLEVRRGTDLLDAQETTFGVRSVDMVANRAAPPGSADLTLVVNRQREFLRGVNWVPADSLFARITAKDYADLLSLAKAAHVNLLRVWGGGLREKKAFYDLCDQEGILVWQEFPLACAFFDHYPSADPFIQLMEQEAEGIVRRLRNHPSLAIWCGGNEFAPSRNRRIVGAIKQAVEELDRSRPFLPASPGRGDGHNWRVWHGKANVRDYQKDKSLLASEFGLQAAPDVSSLAKFLPPEALYPPGEQWEYHSAQLDKLKRYAAPLLAVESVDASTPEALANFVEATQKAQALGLQVAVEHFRRRKGYTSGTLIWQLNEPWPAICWSLIDYFRQPKLAYHKLKDLYNPVLISLSYPLKRYRSGDTFDAEVWAVNDLLQSFLGCELRLFLGDRLVDRRSLSLEPNSCCKMGEVEFALEEVGMLRLELATGEEILCRNSYDLSHFDPAEISRWDALRNWLAWRVLK